MSQNPALNSGAVSRVYAVVFALAAFVVAVIAGLRAENAGSDIIIDAISVMVVCYLVGTLLGAVAEHAVRQHLHQYREGKPVPQPEPQQV